MGSSLMAAPVLQLQDGNGDALAGAKAFFYLTGTTTPAAAYQDSALTTAHDVPVTADASGLFPPIYLNPTITYSLTVKRADDTVFSTIPTLTAQKSASGFDYSGSGVPGSGLGDNDDTYLNIANGDTYLKSGGSWSLVGSISGGGSALSVEDDGTELTAAATKLNFAGEGAFLSEPVADQIRISVGRTFVDVKEKYGCDGTSGDRAKIQSALTSEARGSTLVFRTMIYGTDHTELTLSKSMNLLGESDEARIFTQKGTANTGAVLNIQIPPGSGDFGTDEIRHMSIRNLSIVNYDHATQGANGDGAIKVSTADGSIPLRDLEITGCRLSGSSAGDIAAMTFGYAGDNAQDISQLLLANNTIIGGVVGRNVVDGLTMRRNTFSGNRMAMDLESRRSAAHIFELNQFVCRDGVGHLKSMQMFHFLRNTIEATSANQNTATIGGGVTASLIIGQALPTTDTDFDFSCADFNIAGNNFNTAAAYVGWHLYFLGWANNGRVDRNTFLNAATGDVFLGTNTKNIYVAKQITGNLGHGNMFRTNGISGAGNNYQQDFYGRTPVITDNGSGNSGWLDRTAKVSANTTLTGVQITPLSVPTQAGRTYAFRFRGTMTAPTTASKFLSFTFDHTGTETNAYYVSNTDANATRRAFGVYRSLPTGDYQVECTGTFVADTAGALEFKALVSSGETGTLFKGASLVIEEV